MPFKFFKDANGKISLVVKKTKQEAIKSRERAHDKGHGVSRISRKFFVRKKVKRGTTR